MRWLTGLFFLMLVQAVSATECRVNGGAWYNADTTLFGAYVSVAADLATDKVSLADYTLECHSGNVLYNETMSTAQDAVMLYPGYGHLAGGLRVNQDYPIPVPGGIVLSVQNNYEPPVTVRGEPYLKITRAPGKYVQIRSGDQIAAVKYQVVTRFNALEVNRFDFWLRLYAKNSLNLSPSTCTLNDDKPIDIDFEAVESLSVTENNPFSTPNKRSFAMSMSCPDLGITTPVDISLIGMASSFNSNGLLLSNPDLAVVAYRTTTHQMIPPGGSFSGTITNSFGVDYVTFALVRKPGSFPAEGPFTGSATLVMSVP